MEKLKEFDKDKLDEALLKKIDKYTANPDYSAEVIGKARARTLSLSLSLSHTHTHTHTHTGRRTVI